MIKTENLQPAKFFLFFYLNIYSSHSQENVEGVTSQQLPRPTTGKTNIFNSFLFRNLTKLRAAFQNIKETESEVFFIKTKQSFKIRNE